MRYYKLNYTAIQNIKTIYFSELWFFISIELCVAKRIKYNFIKCSNFSFTILYSYAQKWTECKIILKQLLFILSHKIF